jgi:hypothetical protein
VIRWSLRSFAVATVLVALALPPRASAIPVYSRKYATSCVTCHTVFPKLTQFGEAFRRNGFRFPGAFDSDYVKGEIIPLGQEESKKDFPNAVWPSFMTAVPLLGFGLSGRTVIHPDSKAAAAIADNGTVVSLDRLATSGSVYAAGSIDDSMSFFGIAAVSDTAASLDETVFVWSDLFGPRHLVNLSIGYAYPTLSPFGRSSTYVGGRQLFGLSLTTLYGGSGAPFRVNQRYNLAEVNGTAAGRFEYGFGADSGGHVDGPRTAANFYGHLAVKMGGMRLDGEGSPVASDPSRPWAEWSATLFGYAYASRTRFNPGPPSAAKSVVADDATSLGGGARFQAGSAELSVSGLYETHDHVTAQLAPNGLPHGADQVAFLGELSYIVFPWLVPAVRVEHVIVTSRGGSSANDTRILPAVDMMVRPNLKLTVAATLERASGLPDGGGKWSNLSGDGLYVTPASTTTPVSLQFSLINVSAQFGF